MQFSVAWHIFTKLRVYNQALFQAPDKRNFPSLVHFAAFLGTLVERTKNPSD